MRSRSEAVRIIIHRYHTYNFRFQLLRQKIVSSYNIAAVCCNRHVQENLLSSNRFTSKSKPHLGFQNLGCHCKILGCHFDTQIGFKKRLIILIFYCGLMVHITDTRAQKVASYTTAHITETVFAHDQHFEEQSTSTSPQLYRHSQKHRKWITTK